MTQKLMPIVVDVFAAARTGDSVSGDVRIDGMTRLRPLLASSEGTVAYRYSAFVDGRQRPAGSLSLRAVLGLTCSHCEQPVAFTLEASREYSFVHDERALEAIGLEDADSEPLVGSPRFDLDGLIEDELILELPIAPRHPACQREIDAGARPAVEMAARPFAALAALQPAGGTRPPDKQ